jgi:exosortase C (VPDSG-CTERM-specific)
MIGFGVYGAALAAVFAMPLGALPRFALKSELYSYIILVPFISGYLLRLKRAEFPGGTPGPTPIIAVLVPALAGVAALAAYALISVRRWRIAEADYLSLTVFAFVCFLLAGSVWCFGWDRMRRLAFPVGFLVFLAPFPVIATDWLEEFLRHASAAVAAGFFALTGETVLRDGTMFHLPGINLEVAKECSGIHSSLVLFITSLLAGHLFLRSPWKKAVLALAVIPLGILRNGFRILTISMLCVHVDPSMIDSPIHHQGGPIFFVLSLVPFAGLLFLMRRWDGLGKAPKAAAPAGTASMK